jgi:nucleoid DNA-binding protein
MDGQAKTLVTRDIIRELRTRGLSRRQAVRIFNAILDEMKAALKRGEEVEWPFGSLKTVRHPRKPKRGWHLHKITTLYKRQFTVSLVRAKEFKDPRIQKQEEEEERRQFLQSRIEELRRATLELMKLNAKARATKRST